MAHGADTNAMYTLPVCKSSESAGVDWSAVKTASVTGRENNAGWFGGDYDGYILRNVMVCSRTGQVLQRQ